MRANSWRPIFSSSPSEATFFGATEVVAAPARRCNGAVAGACTRAEIFAGGGCAAPPIAGRGGAAADGTAGGGEITGGRGGGGGGATVGAGGFRASCGGATGLSVTAVSFAGTGAGSGGFCCGFEKPTG